MKTIIEMAREAGLIGSHEPSEKWIKEFSHLVALVRADEREACAKVVEASPSYDWHRAGEAAAAIRARGNT